MWTNESENDVKIEKKNWWISFMKTLFSIVCSPNCMASFVFIQFRCLFFSILFSLPLATVNGICYESTYLYQQMFSPLTMWTLKKKVCHKNNNNTHTHHTKPYVIKLISKLTRNGKFWMWFSTSASLTTLTQ